MQELMASLQLRPMERETKKSFPIHRDLPVWETVSTMRKIFAMKKGKKQG